jgi:murein DD-endopeptidase MepM/ murein hydrolase activator NlpD
VSQADELGVPTAGALPDLVSQRAAVLAGLFSEQPKIVGMAVASRPDQAAAASGYLNPLRAVAGLVPERIDEGVDFSGTGPVYAVGNAVITNAGENYGWPGGGWITYRLTDGPAAGLMVYLAEDVTPDVQVGQRVTASTVIANMFNWGDGIETGWAQPTGVSAESELPEAGGIGGGGPFPTMVGLNFDQLLQSLGVPAAPNAADPAYGVLPARYPAR